MGPITLPNVRSSSDITIKARLKDGGMYIAWSTLSDIKAYIFSDAQKAVAGRCAVSIDSGDDTILVCEYSATKPQYPGVNSLVVRATYFGRIKTYDVKAINIVPRTSNVSGNIVLDDPVVDLELEVTDISSSLLDMAVRLAFQAVDEVDQALITHTGPEGKSAYRVAVDNGFVGTEQEWLASLVGPEGPRGQRGQTGERGPAGVTGAEVSVSESTGTPHAEITVINGILSLVLDGLKGETGPQGSIGPQGPAGATGERGPAGVTSAEVTVLNSSGTPAASATVVNGVLKIVISGIKGDQGNSGYSGAAGELEVVNSRYQGGATAAWSAEQGKLLSEEVDNRLSNVSEMTPISTVVGKFFHNDGERTNASMEYKLYSVLPGGHYAFSGVFHHLTSTIQFVRWLDANQQNISGAGYHAAGESADAVYEDQIIVAPATAVYAAFNIQINQAQYSSFKVLDPIDFDQLQDDVDENTAGVSNLTGAVDELEDTVTEINETVSKKVDILMTPVSDVTGEFINNSGAVRENSKTGYRRYNVEGGKTYAFSGKFTAGYNIRYFAIYQSDGTFIRTTSEFPTDTTAYYQQEITMPSNAGYVLMNYLLSNAAAFTFSSVGRELISSAVLEQRIDAIAGVSENSMKVHVYSMNPAGDEPFFYVRSKYNETKDIIVRYGINYNSLIRPGSAYVGDKNLSDTELMTSANLASSHSDSTAPLFNSTNYWHLFAQHGYVVPTIGNTAGMTSSDVGAVWEDQNSRRYTIGSVSASTITLLPVFYEDANGHTTRGWKTPDSAAITSLTHVSGGVIEGTFSVSNYTNIQLRPLMVHTNRKLFVNGSEIKSAGDYLCSSFTANESQIGYDPSTVLSWFPINFTGAQVMAEFTWSYNFCGANCAVNTTINILREVECASYGATQQQFFYDVTRNGNTYKAMFLIPKAANDLDMPFNSPSSSSPSKQFYRDSSLKDVNDPIDRLVAYLYDDENDDYIVGMAAGLSLVSGDTVREKRITNLAMGNGNYNKHFRVGSLSPDNRNKFYIAAVNTGQFADNQYYFPVGYFKEINYYVSYFDPAENPGQVYWYKDGSRYVVYMHCQEALTNAAIKLPEIMEGLSLSIVEKTDGATLLSSSVQNGKVFVSFTDAANYLVAIVK